jgi:O-antigen/teichoic acid export membrane protein
VQRQILQFGTPVAASCLLEYIMASSDRLIGQYMLDANALGLYRVSHSVAERAVTAAFLAVVVASYPMLLRAFEREGSQAGRRQALQNANWR